MRNKVLIIGAIFIAVLSIVFGIRAVSKRGSQSAEVKPQNAPATTANERATPADEQIRQARAVIRRAPNKPDGYNQLCAAFMQKARETGDFSFNQRAEAALERSLKSAPDNYDALKLRAKLLLANHRFAEALEVARRAVEQRPRDYEIYGVITDAHVELGNYREAVEAADAMVQLRPYTPSYARVSYIRSLHGDSKGAIDAMRMAEQSAGDAESLAWCAVHLGDELLNSGKRAEAEHEFNRALFALPDYHLALAGKARARIAAGDMEGAVDLYRKAQERVPLPDVAIALGNLYARLNRNDEAQRQYELVEFIEHSGTAGAGTYSRHMAVFWADRGVKLDEALAVARRERASRADIYTSDALAWCLYKKGELTEAKTAIDEALRLGTRDAGINYHAGMIYQALGDQRKAAQHLNLALKINPTFDVLQAEVARETLRTLTA
ncbi:MAG: tetratricopeptide repeat protein [Pyrinomonadaceae bacterium]|nr:tetratricopeptide repeat protein [Pyrinomonadaceae bacterium]